MNDMTAHPSPGHTSVAYLLKRYPRLSETFILHEVLELERQGMSLRLYSILDPGEEVVHADVAHVQAPVTYLPEGWHGVPSLVRAHLALLRRDPRRYTGAVMHMVRRWHHRDVLKHFARAGWLALDLERADVTHLHVHFAHGPAATAYFVHLLTGLPYSITAHAKDIYTSPRDLLAIKMRAAQFVVTCTEYNRRYLAELAGGDAGHIHRIYHGLDLRKFGSDGCASSSRQGEAPIILAVGRLVEKKGFSYLIEAVRLLVDGGHDVRLQIVGAGELRDSLQRQIITANLQERVTLLGPRRQEELIELYRAASLFALPSIVLENGDRDGIPNVLVEAMRMGLPVVSTAVSGIPELVIAGETGLLVPPRDAAALAAALALALSEAGLRDRLTAGAGHHVTEEFDLAANTARLRALLEEAVA